MSNEKRALGTWGETAAADYLLARGYAILERNVRTPYGEIDLVAQFGNQIVFIEVKTRKSRLYGAPEVSVSSRKQAHMIACAESYRQSHPDLDCGWQIDVIAIERHGKRVEIVHFENAI